MEHILLVCAASFLVGILANELVRYIFSTHGVLRIDHSNPEKDLYRFEIDELDAISKKKFIFLKVDNNADLTQK